MFFLLKEDDAHGIERSLKERERSSGYTGYDGRIDAKVRENAC